MEQTVVKQKPAVEAAVTPTRETAQKPKIKSPASKKRRKWIKRLIILAVLAALVVFLFKSCSGTGSRGLLHTRRRRPAGAAGLRLRHRHHRAHPLL